MALLSLHIDCVSNPQHGRACKNMRNAMGGLPVPYPVRLYKCFYTMTLLFILLLYAIMNLILYTKYTYQ